MSQGEIWLINLDPTIGAEIRKTRPGVIVSDDALGRLPLKVVVPLTDWKERYSIAPWIVKIEATAENNLAKMSAADCFQIRSVSERRFVRKIGWASESSMDHIRDALSRVLSING